MSTLPGVNPKDKLTIDVTDRLTDASLEEIRCILVEKPPYDRVEIRFKRKRMKKPVSSISVHGNLDQPVVGLGRKTESLYSSLMFFSRFNEIQTVVAEVLQRQPHRIPRAFEQLPKVSGKLDDYVCYVQFKEELQCTNCPMVETFEELTNRQLRGEWTRRQAKRAMKNGWYVPPFAKTGDFVPVCLCPSCATERDLEINVEHL